MAERERYDTKALFFALSSSPMNIQDKLAALILYHLNHPALFDVRDKRVAY
jgi:hypothetical protein